MQIEAQITVNPETEFISKFQKAVRTLRRNWFVFLFTGFLIGIATGMLLMAAVRHFGVFR